MYDLLCDIALRPIPFSRYTTKELWTRPHLATQMLSCHLNQETNLASRQFGSIDTAVDWIDSQVGFRGKTVCDLGCGPGLYTQRFASIGAKVTGVDFSENSLEYAKAQDSQNVRYIHADYLLGSLPDGFDVVTLIYCDFCVLSPSQRDALLRRIKIMLNPQGTLVMDIAGIASLESKEECIEIEERLMDGFWAEGDYVGIRRSYVYTEENLSLDHYLIVEPNDSWQIYNWFQHFTLNAIKTELEAAGFLLDTVAGDLSGEPLKAESEFIGIVARIE